MRTNPEACEGNQTLGKRIERTPTQPAPIKRHIDSDLPRGIVRGADGRLETELPNPSGIPTVSTGWITNPDTIKTGGAVDPGAGDVGYDYCCATDAAWTGWPKINHGDAVKVFSTIAEQQSQQSADYAAMSAVIEAQTATFRNMREAFAIAELEKSRETGTLQGALSKAGAEFRLSLSQQPRSWDELLAENVELRAQIASEQSERIKLTNLLMAHGVTESEGGAT